MNQRGINILLKGCIRKKIGKEPKGNIPSATKRIGFIYKSRWVGGAMGASGDSLGNNILVVTLWKKGRLGLSF